MLVTSLLYQLEMSQKHISKRNTSKRLIIYTKALELFEMIKNYIHNLWEAIGQLYGDVWAVGDWHHKFIRLSTNNNVNVKEFMYDALLLLHRSKLAAIALASDDVFYTIPQYVTEEKEKIPKTIKLRDSQKTQTDIKCVDLIQKESTINISQTAYLRKV